MYTQVKSSYNVGYFCHQTIIFVTELYLYAEPWIPWKGQETPGECTEENRWGKYVSSMAVRVATASA